MAIDGAIQRPNKRKTTSNQFVQHPSRKQRIERWIQKGRSASIHNVKALRSSTIATPSLTQKRSENMLLQDDRRLNMHLFQIGEQRERFIAQQNFDQKLFATKRFLLHKDNPNLLKTLNYARQCCKFTHLYDSDEFFIDPAIFLEENDAIKAVRSRSLASTTALPPKQNPISNGHIPKTTLFTEHNNQQTSKIAVNKNQTYTKQANAGPNDQVNQYRHTQLLAKSNRGSQSAYASTQPRSLIDKQQSVRNIKTVHGIRSYETNPTTHVTPSISHMDHTKEQHKPLPTLNRQSSKILSTKNTLQEFRTYPERFLSTTNCYLPLLRYQAMKTETQRKKQDEKMTLVEKERVQSSSSSSHISDESDSIYDDEDYDGKSSVNEDIETEKHEAQSVSNHHDRREIRDNPVINRTDLKDTIDSNASKRTAALLRLRDREKAHLHTLISTNNIEHILKPLSPMKTYEPKHPPTTYFNNILNSVDFLSSSKRIDKYQRQ